jgi:hypothetical protein
MSLIDQNINWHMAPQGINGQLVYRKKTSETGFFKLMANTSQNQLALDYPRAEDLALTRLDLHNHNVFSEYILPGNPGGALVFFCRCGLYRGCR